ncbi:MAG: subtilisin family serine protease [Lentisphaeria bacterium]|jgi:subtilisin family serine protease
MMHKLYFLVFIFSLSITAVAAPAADERKLTLKREKIAKHYHKLKAKVQNRDKLRVIVRYKNETLDGELQRPDHKKAFDVADLKMQNMGFTAKKRIKSFDVAVYEIDAQQLDKLLDSGLIDKLQEDIPVPPSLLQSIPFIGADAIYNRGYRAQDYAVAVFDTGIETSHSFLGGRVVEEACFSSDSLLSNSLCPNGEEQQIGVGAGVNCNVTDLEDCYHGTHVAGIVGGFRVIPLGSYEFLINTGVAPEANIISVQVFSEFDNFYSGCDGAERCVLANTSDILAGLEWVRDQAFTTNIAAVNMSLGGGEFDDHCDYSILKDAIDSLRSNGIATVISSGNRAFTDAVGHPGCISTAITVGSTGNDTDIISSFSNSAAMVDILAPGEDISSSYLSNGYASASGTSMAAPHVAGAIAVMKSISPYASVDYIENHLKAYGVTIVDPNNLLPFPRLNVQASALEVENKPIAQLDQTSYSVIVGKEGTFDAQASTDPNDELLTYEWDFGDGVSGYLSNEASIDHVYSEIGTYELAMRGYNGIKFSDAKNASVTVYDPVMITIIVTGLLM